MKICITFSETLEDLLYLNNPTAKTRNVESDSNRESLCINTCDTESIDKDYQKLFSNLNSTNTFVNAIIKQEKIIT